jgi:outer membrane lipoprotein-sorting protein
LAVPEPVVLRKRLGQSIKLKQLKETEEMMRSAFILFLLLATLAPVATAKIETAEALFAAMQKKHAKSWYRTLTFVQKSTTFKPDGTSESVIWYEALNAPGKLRIDIDPLKNGNGFMFADGKQYVFKEGKLVDTRDRINPLLVLGFDVYFQPPSETIKQLKEFNFDFSKLHEDTWQGRPVYVVGADKGDVRSPQFWIDKQNLYFVRLIELVGKDKDKVQEILFNKYQKAQGGGWVSPEVVVNLDGKRVFMEEYSEIKTGVKLDDKLFDPQSWTTATHWRQ